MEDSAPSYGSHSFSSCQILSLKSIELGFGGLLRFWAKRCCDVWGSYVEVQELPHVTHLWGAVDCYGLWRIRLSRPAAVKSKPEQLPHETQRRRLRERRQQYSYVVAELDTTNHNHKNTTTSVLPNDTMATGGTQQKTAIGSYLCFPVNQHSKCNNNYSQSLSISANQKADDHWRGNREEDKDPNGGTTVVTVRDEDEKSAYSYNSSFASAQFSTLAISSLLLCLMVLFPNFPEKNQAVTAAALMGATLGSLVSLETILKCPNLARICGYFAIISLLVAIGSILSTSVNWVTI